MHHVSLSAAVEAMSTPAGRAEVERTLVELAAILETSPSLWSHDPETGALRLPGHRPAEVEEALDRVAVEGGAAFGVSGA
ncbi:MAG: hypothetical protein R2725_04860 [Solirubrobacterales bacterium]